MMIRSSILFVVLAAIASVECSNKHPAECTTRFDMRSHTKRMFEGIGPTGCDVIKKMNPVCRSDVIVSYEERPPYVYRNETGAVVGILPGLLKISIDACCYGCNKVHFIGPYGQIDKIFAENASLVIPVDTVSSSNTYSGFDFVRFIRVPGVSFLAPKFKPDTKMLTGQLLTSIVNTWPLFLVALLMALIAGCVVWLLDTWFNQEEFPSSFPQGPFEGFWWAFVSMTTVGYGDRSPKSVSARIFAIFWIFLGITIFSMYTASLTSALTSAVDASHESVYGKKIAVLNTTAVSRTTVLLEHADPVGFHSIPEMVDSLLITKEVYGIAMDDNIARYYNDYFKSRDPDLKLFDRKTYNDISYGVISFDKNLTRFLSSYMENNEDMRMIMAMEAMKGFWHKKTLEKETGVTNVFFSEKSPMFGVTIGILVGIGVVAILIGRFIRCLFAKHKGCIQRYACSSCVYEDEDSLAIDSMTKEQEVELMLKT